MINYYKELGVKKDASLQEIKSAYLKQLKKYHPDIYDGDEVFAQEKTAILNECYNTLKDEHLRAEYNTKLFGNNTNTTTQHKLKKENLFKEFTKNFKINLGSHKTQNNNKNSNSNKTKNQVIKPQKHSKFITEDDINKKERKNLSLAIILVILAIIITFLLILIL